MRYLLAFLIALVSGASHASEWRELSLPSSFKRLNSVCMLSAEEGWAGGRDGLLLRWDGASWHRHPSDISGDIVSVQLTSSRSGWVVTYDIGQQRSLLYRYNGTVLEAVEIPFPLRASAALAVDDQTIWLFGHGSRILRFDGRWQEFVSPGYRTILAAANDEDGSVWAVGEFGAVWHWNGIEWSARSSPAQTHLNGVTVSGDSTIWIVGDGGLVMRGYGDEWKRIENPESAHLFGVSVAGEDDAWFCGSDVLLHWNGNTISRTPAPVHGILRDVQVLPDGFGMAVGYGAVLQRVPDRVEARTPRLGFYRQELLPNVLGVKGVAFGDVNADGADDLYIVSARDANHLLLNDGTGQFSDITGRSGVMGHVATAPHLQQTAQFSAVWGDLTNNGMLDLVVGGWHGSIDLYRQLRDNTFENVSNRLPLDEGPFSINSISLADVNNNGWLDIFVTNEHGSNRLWLNDTRGGWIDATEAWGLESRGGNKQAAFGDLNNNGRPDLYICTWGGRDLVYRNDGEFFTEVTDWREAAGETTQSNGVTFADLNNNGSLDIVVTRSSGRNSIYRNDGDWSFTEVSGMVPFASAPNSYGSAAADFDNNGHVDLIIVSDDGINYFKNVGGMNFVPIIVEGLTDVRGARSIALADVDLDGDMDVFVGSSADFVDHASNLGLRRSSLFTNKLDQRNSISVRLAGVRSNASAIGGRVYLFRDVENGEHELAGMREVAAGAGYLAQHSAQLHFGVDTSAVYLLKAVFPSGETRKIGGVRAGTSIEIAELTGFSAWHYTVWRTVWNWFWSDLVQIHLWPLLFLIPLLVWAVRSVNQRFEWSQMTTALYTIGVCVLYALLLAGTASTPGILARATPPLIVLITIGATVGLSYWSWSLPGRRLLRRRQLEALAQRADLSGVLSSALDTRCIAERALEELGTLLPGVQAAIVVRAADSNAIELVVPEHPEFCALSAGTDLPNDLIESSPGDVFWNHDALATISERGRVSVAIPLNSGSRVIGAMCAVVADRDVVRFKAAEPSIRGFVGLLATSLHNAQLQDQARHYDAAYREWLSTRTDASPAHVTAQSAHRELVRLLGAGKKRNLPPIGTIGSLVGTSERMEDVIDRVRQVARTDATVLLTGESGTGKELAARAIHGESSRSEGPFVAVNCGAIAEGLLESELFGHVKGAFTGADSDRHGVFRRADGGTIFLDEISEMTLAAQVRLLRVLQEHRVLPVGGEREVEVNVRVIAATHRDLEKAVERGDFREDLYYRLNVFPIELPPLRNRMTDVPALIAAILRRISDRLDKNTAGVSEKALERMLSYDWPGNVRELENVLERAVILSGGDLVSEEHLLFRQPREQKSKKSQSEGSSLAGRTLASVEKELIEQTLAECGQNVSEAARRLGVTRDVLRYRLKKYSES